MLFRCTLVFQSQFGIPTKVKLKIHQLTLTKLAQSQIHPIGSWFSMTFVGIFVSIFRRFCWNFQSNNVVFVVIHSIFVNKNYSDCVIDQWSIKLQKTRYQSASGNLAGVSDRRVKCPIALFSSHCVLAGGRRIMYCI